MSRILDKEVQELIEFAFMCNGLSTYRVQKSVIWKWNSRYTDTMGKADYMFMTIELSSKIFDLATKQQQEDTIVHEACHLIAHYKYSERRIKPHGKEWKQCMLNCGITPARCHTVNTSSLRKRKRYYLICDCGKSYLGSKKAFEVIQRWGWICSRCGVERKPMLVKG